MGRILNTPNIQTANTIYAGPTSGGAASATFRSLVVADIPTLNQTTTGGSGAIQIYEDSTVSATRYLTWVTTNSGYQTMQVSSSKLTFNPATGTVTATTFAGALTGNVTGNCTGSAGSVDASAITSGSSAYTPTVTGVTNVTSVGVIQGFRWMRVGNMVTVSGSVSIDPTTASTLTKFSITLPLASTGLGANDCHGTVCEDWGTTPMANGRVMGDATNHIAEAQYYCDSGAANHAVVMIFMYEIK